MSMANRVLQQVDEAQFRTVEPTEELSDVAREKGERLTLQAAQEHKKVKQNLKAVSELGKALSELGQYLHVDVVRSKRSIMLIPPDWSLLGSTLRSLGYHIGRGVETGPFQKIADLDGFIGMLFLFDQFQKKLSF